LPQFGGPFKMTTVVSVCFSVSLFLLARGDPGMVFPVVV
jgi:hypothetical protein